LILAELHCGLGEHNYTMLEELCSKIPFTVHQLREWRLTFASHCYRCEDQPVKHLVSWEGRAGRMLRGQANHMTYVKQLLRDSCCETDG